MLNHDTPEPLNPGRGLTPSHVTGQPSSHGVEVQEGNHGVSAVSVDIFQDHELLITVLLEAIHVVRVPHLAVLLFRSSAAPAMLRTRTEWFSTTSPRASAAISVRSPHAVSSNLRTRPTCPFEIKRC